MRSCPRGSWPQRWRWSIENVGFSYRAEPQRPESMMAMDAQAYSTASRFDRFGTDDDGRVLRRCITCHGESDKTFKKTRCAADLQRTGRVVAKDIADIADVATPKLVRRDRPGSQHRVFGRAAVESLKAVIGISSQPSLFTRSAERERIVGAGPFKPEIDATFTDRLNIKLTAVAGAGHPTARMFRQTNISSGWLCHAAQRVGSTIDGVVTHLGGSHEKYGYAGV